MTPTVWPLVTGPAAMASGADAFVLKRAIATDLLPAVDAVCHGENMDSTTDEGPPALTETPSMPVR